MDGQRRHCLHSCCRIRRSEIQQWRRVYLAR